MLSNHSCMLSQLIDVWIWFFLGHFHGFFRGSSMGSSDHNLFFKGEAVVSSLKFYIGFLDSRKTAFLSCTLWQKLKYLQVYCLLGRSHMYPLPYFTLEGIPCLLRSRHICCPRLLLVSFEVSHTPVPALPNFREHVVLPKGHCFSLSWKTQIYEMNLLLSHLILLGKEISSETYQFSHTSFFKK